MRKIILITLGAILLFSAGGLFAQNLLDNPEYRKGLEYQNMAKQSYNIGDYDKSIEYSELAQGQFKKARESAEKMRLRFMAYNLKNRASDRIKYADYINAAVNFPVEYGKAKVSYAASDTAFNREEYQPSIDASRMVLDYLRDIRPLTAAPMEDLARADALRNIIQKYNLASVRPVENQKGNTAYDAGKGLIDKENARAKQLLLEAIKNYQIVVDAGINSMADARRAELEAAKKRADGVNAETLAAEAYAEARKNQNDAEMMLRSKSYDEAWSKFAQAIRDYNKSYDLAMSKQTPVLPEFYTVRLLPDRRDCFWRIAEYDFVYGDPWKWKLLYEENKALIPDPKNPDLIQPGTRIRIPSAAGEKRSGEWQPPVK
jgi:hypothetical protein